MKPTIMLAHFGGTKCFTGDRRGKIIRIFSFGSMVAICTLAYCSRTSAQSGCPNSDSPQPSPTISDSPGYDTALAQRNGGKRQQMVQNAVSNWNPPQQLVTSASPLGATKLSDPFAVVSTNAVHK